MEVFVIIFVIQFLIILATALGFIYTLYELRTLGLAVSTMNKTQKASLEFITEHTEMRNEVALLTE